MSRSVTVPTSRSPSQIARNPISRTRIFSAAVAIVVSGLMHSTFRVIIALTFITIPPLLSIAAREASLCRLLRNHIRPQQVLHCFKEHLMAHISELALFDYVAGKADLTTEETEHLQDCDDCGDEVIAMHHVVLDSADIDKDS